MIQAIEITPKRDNIVFPTPNSMPTNTNSAAMLGIHASVYNHILDTNDEQLQAVRRVIDLPAGSPPFIIFGP
jgi:helicase MOV-10